MPALPTPTKTRKNTRKSQPGLGPQLIPKKSLPAPRRKNPWKRESNRQGTSLPSRICPRVSGGRVAERPVGSPIIPVKSPIRKIAVCPKSWKCLSLRRTTVCPRCRSGAVGSMPSFTRSGLPVERDFSSLARRSASRMISAEPFFKYVSCSSTGAKVAMEVDYSGRCMHRQPRRLSLRDSDQLPAFHFVFPA